MTDCVLIVVILASEVMRKDRIDLEDKLMVSLGKISGRRDLFCGVAEYIVCQVVRGVSSVLNTKF